METRANSLGFAVSSVGLAIQALFAALLVAQVDINWSYLVPTRLAYDGNGVVNAAGVVLYSAIAVGIFAVAFFGAPGAKVKQQQENLVWRSNRSRSIIRSGDSH